MSRFNWVSMRNRWASKKTAPMPGYTRVYAEQVGSWPQVYKADADGTFVVTGIYFKPKVEKYSRMISTALVMAALYIVTHLDFDPQGEGTDLKTFATIGLICAVLAWFLGRRVCYYLFSKRVRVAFRPGGEIRCNTGMVPAGEPRTFSVRDHHLARQEELNEQQHLRQNPGSTKYSKRYYRNSCEVILSYGAENIHRFIIAEIGADQLRTLGDKMRGVLADASNKSVTVPASNQQKPVAPNRFD